MIRRVPADPDERGCPYLVGGIYQKRLRGVEGRPSFKVTALPEMQKLGDVTRADVIAEGGFNGARAPMMWKLDWVDRWDRWAKTHPQASEARIFERWRTYHASRYCWVLTIALVEKPRLLAPQRDILAEVARRGTQQQQGRTLGDGDEYTSGSTIDREAEAVDEGTLTRIVAGELRGRAEVGLSRRDRRRMRRERLFGDGL